MVPGVPVSSPKVEVIGAGVVEVHGPFDETKPEHLSVEVDVALGIGCDCGDAVKTYDGCSHELLRLIVFGRMRRRRQRGLTLRQEANCVRLRMLFLLTAA